MYYDIEEEFRKKEPDIDEELNNLEKRRIAAEEKFELSEKTKEDYAKLDYALLAIAENKNRLLEKKLIKKEVENSKYRSAYFELLEKSRYMLAEKLFLCLLCGFATTLFLPAPESFFTFLFEIICSFIFVFVVMLFTILFPKEKARFWLGSFYENHPFLYAIIVFIIAVVVITVYRYIKGGI